MVLSNTYRSPGFSNHVCKRVRRNVACDEMSYASNSHVAKCLQKNVACDEMSYASGLNRRASKCPRRNDAGRYILPGQDRSSSRRVNTAAKPDTHEYGVRRVLIRARYRPPPGVTGTRPLFRGGISG